MKEPTKENEKNGKLHEKGRINVFCNLLNGDEANKTEDLMKNLLAFFFDLLVTKAH